MEDKLDLIKMASIVVNEADLLHCTIEYAWENISDDITSQFNFEEIKSIVESLFRNLNKEEEKLC